MGRIIMRVEEMMIIVEWAMDPTTYPTNMICLDTANYSGGGEERFGRNGGPPPMLN
jgi:hypothetical protein